MNYDDDPAQISTNLTPTPNRLIAQSPNRRIPLGRLAILLIILGVATFVAWRLGYFQLLANGGLRRLMARLRQVAWIGPLYVIAFGIVAALGIPLTPLILLAGGLFGFIEGAVVAWVGLILGTSGAYWIARLIGGSAVSRMLAGRESIVARLHGRRGFLSLLRLRAIPLIPSILLDYAAGTARMDYLAYVGATMLGSLISTVIYAFVASRVAAGLTKGAAHEALVWSLGAGLVLVIMSFAPALVRRMRGAVD